MKLVPRRVRTVVVRGRDARGIPKQASRNAAAIAARALLAARDDPRDAQVTLVKGLPLSGGLGGSAASSVGGALAAALALGGDTPWKDVFAAAAIAEASVSGEHLDNLAPCLLGGLVLVRDQDPPDLVPLTVTGEWWVALVSPAVRLETRAARAVLPARVPRSVWVRQLANSAALVHAFAQGDGALARRALVDHFAEPARKHLIPRFDAVKAAALAAGALGCSISGAGPTIFALAQDQALAQRCGRAMRRAFGDIATALHVGRVPGQGAHRV